MHGSIWFHWRGDDYLAARSCTISGVDIAGKVSIPSTDVIQLTLILEMTTAQVVETSVTVNNNSPSLFRTTFTRTIILNLLLK